jgi:hypothetical protein
MSDVEICTRTKPLSVEKGQKVGCDTLAHIALTQEEMKMCNSLDTKKRTVTNNAVPFQPGVQSRVMAKKMDWFKMHHKLKENFLAFLESKFSKIMNTRSKW